MLHWNIVHQWQQAANGYPTRPLHYSFIRAIQEVHLKIIMNPRPRSASVASRGGRLHYYRSENDYLSTKSHHTTSIV